MRRFTAHDLFDWTLYAAVTLGAAATVAVIITACTQAPLPVIRDELPPINYFFPATADPKGWKEFKRSRHKKPVTHEFKAPMPVPTTTPIPTAK